MAMMNDMTAVTERGTAGANCANCGMPDEPCTCDMMDATSEMCNCDQLPEPDQG
jgi:hypothetical protein